MPIERSTRTREEILISLNRSLDSAYDLSSGGMGIHMHALSKLVNNDTLPDWTHTSLTTNGSNYIAQPYVLQWIYPESWGGGFQPTVMCPDSELHKTLIQSASKEYKTLDRKMIRTILSGEKKQSASISGNLFTQQEFTALLNKASVNETYFSASQLNFKHIRPPEYWFDFFKSMIKSGLGDSDALYDDWHELSLNSDFREETLNAATLKLGSMLAITDQITFEANELGSPVQYDYRPRRAESGGKWRTSWKDIFDEKMPGIGKIYENSHTVLLESLGSRDSQLLDHIVSKPSLPQLD